MSPFIPWGVRQKHQFRDSQCAPPQKGGSSPNRTPWWLRLRCSTSKTGGVPLVRSESYGEWPAQHAEVRWKQKKYHMFSIETS